MKKNKILCISFLQLKLCRLTNSKVPFVAWHHAYHFKRSVSVKMFCDSLEHLCLCYMKGSILWILDIKCFT